MDTSLFMLPVVGIFFYLLLFPYLSVPNVVFTVLLIRLLKGGRYDRARFWALLFPVAGIAFYLTVDAFEARNLVVLWHIALGVISLTPLALYFVLRKKVHQKPRA